MSDAVVQDGAHDRPLLYVARTKIGQRPLINEPEIVRLFEARGFEVIHPQELSWTDLLRLFARPAVVAGAYGSALRNLAFCREKPIGFVMFPPYDDAFIRGSALWLADMGVRFGYVRGRSAAIGSDADPVKAPWVIDTAHVERALDRLLARVTHPA